MNPFPAFAVDSAIPLQGAVCRDFLLEAIRQATSRVWANIFIVDVRLHEDPLLLVRSLLHELIVARWRQVDVRVVVTASDTQDIFLANMTSLLYLRDQGIASRLYHSDRRSSNHSKYVVLDDHSIVVGSHNWTHRAFALNVEQSIAVHSAALTQSLALEFLGIWNDSQEVVSHET
jgi:phosphatidylserine/phosphatidylglycerophosphate/cardiolipin synthase-like enzyme